jgi:opacity protein-like surface antigen
VTAGQTYSKDELLDDRIQFFDKDRNWVAGGYVGFMVRPQQGPFEIGIEADYIWTDIKFTRREEGGPILEAKAIEGVITVKDQWNASVRGRAGIHIVEPLMLYGTAGAAWSDLGGSGMVYGGGLELALGPVVALRAEVLRYELDDVSSNVVRGGITLKTN